MKRNLLEKKLNKIRPTMKNKNKNKISDVVLLQTEKKRLKEICEVQEEKLKAHVEELRNHSFEMVLHSILPFEIKTQNKIIGVLELLNETILSPLFGISFGKENKNRNQLLLKLMQTVVIALSVKFFRRIFSKKKRHEEPAAE